MVGEPRVDDARAELGAQVEREVREAHVVGDAAGDPDRGGAAAGALAVVLGVAPQLERHGDRVRAAAERRDRRIDAAAHRHERAGGIGGEPCVRADRPAERLVERVGGEVGGVELARGEPAERRGDLRGADPGDVQDGGSLDELDHGAARGDRGAAAARGEPHAFHPIALHGERDRDQVAADGAAGDPLVGVFGERVTVPREGEMVGEALVGHGTGRVDGVR